MQTIPQLREQLDNLYNQVEQEHITLEEYRARVAAARAELAKLEAKAHTH